MERRRQEIARRLRLIRAEFEAAPAAMAESGNALARREWFIRSGIQGSAWAASAERLAQLVSDAGLIAELSTFYGNLADLQWALRLRTENHPGSETGESVTNGVFVIRRQIEEDLPNLTRRVAEAIAEPPVEAAGG